MENRILGLHHITAIASSAKNNLHFYTHVLGLRLVKKTVNFDDPTTYHLYYGNHRGTPGTILTFFPWQTLSRGQRGTKQATAIRFSIPPGSLDFWSDRFAAEGLMTRPITPLFHERGIAIDDGDGLALELIESPVDQAHFPAFHPEIPAERAIIGLHQVTLMVNEPGATIEFLTRFLGYRLHDEKANRIRLVNGSGLQSSYVELEVIKDSPPGQLGRGSNHHVAFTVENEITLMACRQLIQDAGFTITDKIDRTYFFSVYFREPGGVLFELATIPPGFTVDEPEVELGTHLMLPPQYEPRRLEIENHLPPLR